ncbi:DsbE family thiol:disulfide interchange protein [Candidatus Pelagibacter sp.]|jgi:cytochrome c biogenesis protein CcmG/thiol:disulfide interchange protein DsbE|nr:DsbE family thiol:disulfide interchange protein [Candidatus Pelagibacter sp.]
MKNFFLPISFVIIFIIIFVVFYKGLKNTNIYTPDVKINNEVPSFSAKSFYSNEKINSSDVFEKDKFYLLNIWSSWCVPCKDEHPILMELNTNNAIVVIGINYKDNKENAKNFLSQLGNPYQRIFVDTKGTLSIEWGAFGVPESFIIYNKKILKKFIGPLNEETLLEIKQLIK